MIRPFWTISNSGSAPIFTESLLLGVVRLFCCRFTAVAYVAFVNGLRFSAATSCGKKSFIAFTPSTSWVQSVAASDLSRGNHSPAKRLLICRMIAGSPLLFSIRDPSQSKKMPSFMDWVVVNHILSIGLYGVVIGI